jgi:putative FmdB family regulatory protein
MPTYEYRCDACKHEFEKFQSITSQPIKKCPKCGKNKVKRLISTGAGLIFKGSGFYITDYRDSGYAEKAKAESGGGDAKSSDAAKTESKAETKPAESKPDAESKPKTETKPKSDSSPRKKKD